MKSLDAELAERLNAIREQKLFRELRRVDSPQGPCLEIEGKRFLNFSSNDYLGLANEPSVKEGAIKATERFGTGSGASRLICGSLAPHHQLEELLAEWKTTEAAITFSSGYATAVGTITALMDKDAVIVLDKLVHASIVDAARLSGAKLRIFDHNDLNDLEKILQWARSSNASTNVLIVTESIFSMDGDAAPLKEIVALKEKYGVWLMVDEAHATGLYGTHRCGLAQHFGVADKIEIQMGTLGKALGSSGGYICGSRNLIDFIVNKARSLIFSTAPVPAVAGAGIAAIQLVRSNDGARRQHALYERIQQLSSGLSQKTTSLPQAIIPVMIGDEQEAVQASTALRSHSFFVPAIRFPTVARGKARLRVTLTASHTADDVTALVKALISAVPALK